MPAPFENALVPINHKNLDYEIETAGLAEAEKVADPIRI